MVSKRRQLSKVCARCRKRKTKCDLKFPECTPCKVAGEVCQGYDSATRTLVARSLVRSLEDQIAELESRADGFMEKPQNIPYLLAHKIAQSTISVGTPSSRSFFHSNVSEDLFLHPSFPPLAIVRQKSSVDRPRTPLPMTINTKRVLRKVSLPSLNLNTVPVAAIDRMIRNYTQIHLPQYPCVSESWLNDAVRRVLKEQDGDTNSVLVHGISLESGLGHFHYFVVFIVLAISSMTLTWRGELQAITASESFFTSAIKHVRLMECSEIESLQTSLLLAHYAHMNPEKADNWTCIANAVRIALDLGLHKGRSYTMDAKHNQLRCRLFWVTYGMDRSMCGMLQLPLSFPEESIFTELDLPFDDDIENTQLAIQLARKNSSANHIYLFRGLEAEVHRVLHLKEDLESVSEHGILHWIENITARAHIWYMNAQKFAEYRMLEFRDVQYNTLLARIHRPTPRLGVRTPDDRMICLDATKALVEDYVKQSKQGTLLYPWHGVHILFEAAVIASDACWRSRTSSSEPMRERVKHALSVSLPECLNLLTKIGERWKEATRCADVLRPIIVEVSRWFNDPLTIILDTEPGSIWVEEEIQKLVFPDGSISWNITSVEESLVMDGTNSGLGDFFGYDPEMDLFQWDPSWDTHIPSLETV